MKPALDDDDTVACVLEIREARASDLDAVVALMAQLGGGAPLAPGQARAIFDRYADYPDYRLYVALRDGRVAGCFSMLVMDNLAHGGAKSAIVEDVVVDAALRGQGIGTRMMDFARGRGREQGCYKLALSSGMPREAAHRFYESLGFRRHGYSFWTET